MAEYVGREGMVTVGVGSSDPVAYMDQWTINGEIGTADITAYGNASVARTNLLRGWTATFGGTLDDSDGDQRTLLDQFEDGTIATVTLRFYANVGTTVYGVGAIGSTSEFWEGAAIMQSADVNSQVAEKVSLTFNVQGTSGLSWNSAT